VSKAIIDMLRVIFNFSSTQLIPEVIFSPFIAILTRPAPVSYCLQAVREVHWFDDRKYMLLGIKRACFNLPLVQAQRTFVETESSTFLTIVIMG
jgi:hypothetical protein